MAILTPEEFAAQVGAGPLGAPADAAFVTAACAAVVSYLRWNPERPAADVVTWLDGTGTAEVVIPGLPVALAVAEVRADGRGGFGDVPDSFDDGTILTRGVDYLLDAAKGILRMWRTPANGWWGGYGGASGVGPSQYWGGLATGGARPAYWPRVPGCIKLTYRNGYTADTMPADLKSAAVQLAAWLRSNSEFGGLTATSQSYIDVSVGLSQTAAENLGNVSMPALGGVRAMLAGYREVVVAGGVR